MVFGSPSQSNLKKSVQLCALRAGRVLTVALGRGSVRAAAGPSIWHSLKIRIAMEDENDWAMPSMSTESWFTHRSDRELESSGVAKRGVQMEPLAAARTEPRRARAHQEGVPLTLKVACMASPSRFDRRENRPLQFDQPADVWNLANHVSVQFRTKRSSRHSDLA
jgi:hypothetical protein